MNREYFPTEGLVILKNIPEALGAEKFPRSQHVLGSFVLTQQDNCDTTSLGQSLFSNNASAVRKTKV